MKKLKNKAVFFIAIIIGCTLFFAHTVCAEEKKKEGYRLIPEGYSDVIDSLPDDVSDRLPDGIYSDDADVLGDAVAKMSSAEYLLAYIGELLSFGLGDALKLLMTLVGILIISAVFSSFRFSIASESLSRTVSFCTSCALFGCVIGSQISHLERVAVFFERINTLMLGMIPVSGVIYAMGGNVTTAITNGGTLYLFLAFCENFCAKTVMPVASICTAFSICAAIAPSVNVKGFSSALKRGYTFILGLIMTILLATLSSQTTLSAAADSVSARAAKLVASNVIPIVGGSVGETLRTVASSVGYLKSVCGIGTIIFILLLVLPILTTLLLTRAAFIISVAVADLIGCDSESRMLSELGSVYGTMIAVVCMVSVMFIFALTVFVRCSVAAG